MSTSHPTVSHAPVYFRDTETPALEDLHGNPFRSVGLPDELYCPQIHQELADAFEPVEPTPEQLEADYAAVLARTKPQTHYEVSVGMARGGKYEGFVRVPGKPRPVSAGKYKVESEAWRAARVLANELQQDAAA